MKHASSRHHDEVDRQLISLIREGNKEALSTLLLRHKDFIYNVALRMTGHTQDAEDVTQEIMLKVVTRLESFQFNSSFKTWLYRITVNHLLSMKRKLRETVFSSFSGHEDMLRNLPGTQLEGEFAVSKSLLVEETKTECMLGMLLCLSREQRVIFILSGIFSLDSRTGAEILEITESSYRKRLSRARQELKNYMGSNCSLIDKNNSCSCARKTRAAIEKGIIDPEHLQYTHEHVKRVRDMVESSNLSIEEMIELRHQEIFKDNPYQIFEMKRFNQLMGNELTLN